MIDRYFHARRPDWSFSVVHELFKLAVLAALADFLERHSDLRSAAVRGPAFGARGFRARSGLRLAVPAPSASARALCGRALQPARDSAQMQSRGRARRQTREHRPQASELS